MIQVPLDNLFYLLCYASNCLEVRGTLDVSAVSGKTPMALYAQLLHACVARLRRRGVPRQYRVFEETTSAPRGRISLGSSIARGLLPRQVLSCEIDALTADIAFNRLVKAALRRIAGHPHVRPEPRRHMRSHVRFLGQVSDVAPQARDFAEARHSDRLDPLRAFLLFICELVLSDLLVREHDQAVAQRSDFHFDRWDGSPQNMGRLFESFVRVFLQREQRIWQVRKPPIPWSVESSKAARRMLPRMEGDVLLWRPEQRVLIECKFTSPTGPKRTLKSGHLYQLQSYLRHLACDGKTPPIGVLLYPQVERSMALDYRFADQQLAVRTLNLNQPWDRIHDDIQALAREFANPARN